LEKERGERIYETGNDGEWEEGGERKQLAELHKGEKEVTRRKTEKKKFIFRGDSEIHICPKKPSSENMDQLPNRRLEKACREGRPYRTSSPVDVKRRVLISRRPNTHTRKKIKNLPASGSHHNKIEKKKKKSKNAEHTRTTEKKRSQERSTQPTLESQYIVPPPLEGLEISRKESKAGKARKARGARQPENPASE